MGLFPRVFFAFSHMRALTFAGGLELEAVGPLALVELVGGHDLHDVHAVRPKVGDVHLSRNFIQIFFYVANSFYTQPLIPEAI